MDKCILAIRNHFFSFCMNLKYKFHINYQSMKYTNAESLFHFFSHLFRKPPKMVLWFYLFSKFTYILCSYKFCTQQHIFWIFANNWFEWQNLILHISLFDCYEIYQIFLGWNFWFFNANLISMCVWENT